LWRARSGSDDLLIGHSHFLAHWDVERTRENHSSQAFHNVSISRANVVAPDFLCEPSHVWNPTSWAERGEDHCGCDRLRARPEELDELVDRDVAAVAAVAIARAK
jgi:hypothetical protein